MGLYVIVMAASIIAVHSIFKNVNEFSICYCLVVIVFLSVLRAVLSFLSRTAGGECMWRNCGQALLCTD